MTADVALRFTAVGWRTSVQDLGRRGSERLGVPRGGAADQGSARVANVLVGNDQHAALIESLGGAVAFTPSHDVLIAATGSVASVVVDGYEVESAQPVVVPAGADVRVRCGEFAARSYIAVRGDLRTPRFLGSAAPDIRMGFAQAIAIGSVLSLSAGVTRFEHPYPGRALFRLPVPAPTFPEGDWVIDIVDCPETDRIPGIRDLLASASYRVDARSDHVGLRLEGPVLHPADDSEILSHGVPIGAIEIPHSDELIVLGRYRTLTAGYPIVGFVTRQCQDLIGQALPGRDLRFVWSDRRTARMKSMRFEVELAVLEAAVADAFAAQGLRTENAGAIAFSGRN